MSTQQVRNMIRSQVDGALKRAKIELRNEAKKKINELKNQLLSPEEIMKKLQVEIDCVESFKDLLKVVRENSLEKTSYSLLEPPSRSHALKLLNLYSPQAA